MQNRLFLKIFIGFFVTAALISSLLFILSFNISKTFYINSLKNDFQNIGNVLAEDLAVHIQNRNISALGQNAGSLGRKTGRRITIIDARGGVLADSESDASHMESHLNRPEFSKALAGETGMSVRFSATLKSDMLYVAVPARAGRAVIGAVRVSLSLAEIDHLLSTFRKTTLKLIGLMMMLLLAASYVFSRSITGPITKLSSAAKRIASGDFGAKVYLKGRDEIKELADSFNNMADQVKALFSEVSSKKEELSKIIDSIQEGLLIIGAEENIHFTNDAFRKLSSNPDPAGKRYWEVLRHNIFIETVRNTQSLKENSITEFDLNGKTLLCSAAYIGSSGETVVLLYDISAIKGLEQIKKDIVVNVSHELRTPLTAIKGYIETMEDEVKGETRNYLEIIKNHTDRLINIVNDLLTLSGLEDKGANLTLEKMNLVDAARSAAKVFEQKLTEKKLILSITPENGIFYAKADPFRMEQVFINLLDNAIKYTDKGGISLAFSNDGTSVILEVSDTGSGIPKEHLARVFERFYVVDKSRARSMGGTGLGLSIVKHIILLHNGTITVDSELSKGTKFTITLPAA